MEVLPNLPKFQFFLESHLADHFTRQGLKLCTLRNPASHCWTLACRDLLNERLLILESIYFLIQNFTTIFTFKIGYQKMDQFPGMSYPLCLCDYLEVMTSRIGGCVCASKVSVEKTVACWGFQRRRGGSRVMAATWRIW